MIGWGESWEKACDGYGEVLDVAAWEVGVGVFDGIRKGGWEMSMIGWGYA